MVAGGAIYRNRFRGIFHLFTIYVEESRFHDEVFVDADFTGEVTLEVLGGRR